MMPTAPSSSRLPFASPGAHQPRLARQTPTSSPSRFHNHSLRSVCCSICSPYCYCCCALRGHSRVHTPKKSRPSLLARQTQKLSQSRSRTRCRCPHSACYLLCCPFRCCCCAFHAQLRSHTPTKSLPRPQGCPRGCHIRPCEHLGGAAPLPPRTRVGCQNTAESTAALANLRFQRFCRQSVIC